MRSAGGKSLWRDRSKVPVRDRPKPSVVIGWGLEAYDVSDDVQSFRVVHGSEATNSSRSVVRTGRGSLLLKGTQWQPGHDDAVVPVGIMSTRAEVRVNIGASLVWCGWVDEPYIVPRSAIPLTRYRLSGLLESRGTNRHDFVSSAPNPFSDSELWDRLGLNRPLVPGEPGFPSFAPFRFRGIGFEFVSKLGVVSGRIVGETSEGQLSMPTFGRLPVATAQKSLSDELVNSVEVDRDARAVRNRIVLPFARDAVTGGQSLDGSVIQGPTASRASPASQYTATLTLPDPDGAEYSNFRLEILEASAVATAAINTTTSPDTYGFQNVDVLGHVSGSVAVSGRTARVTIISALPTERVLWSIETTARTRGTSGTSRTVDVGDPYPISSAWPRVPQCNGRRSIRFTPDPDRGRPYGTYSGTCQPTRTITTSGTPGGIRTTTSTQDKIGEVRSTSDGPSAGRWEAIRVRFRVLWDSDTPVPDHNIQYDFGPSQANWGIQEIDFPLWLAEVGLGINEVNGRRIIADLAVLGSPRTVFVVKMPLWQRTASRSAFVAGIDFGDYVNLDIEDTLRGVSVDARTVCAQREIRFGPSEVPTVELRLLETGPADLVRAIPDAPTGLAVLAVSHVTLAVSWDSVERADSYEGRYRAATSSDWVDLGSTLGTSFTIRGLAASTNYVVEVLARNVLGASGYSRATGTTSAVPTAAPGAPTGLSVSEVGETSAVVSWIAPPSGGAPANYRVEWKVSTASVWSNATVNGLTRTITGLTAGVSYDVRVRAQNSVGNSTWLTGSFSTAGLSTPGAVVGLTATAPFYNQVSASWSVPATGGAVDDYDVTLRSGGSTVATATVTGLTHTFAGLMGSTEYTVSVIPANSAGDGDEATATVTTPATPSVALPGVPRNVRARPTDHETVVLDWDAPNTGGAVVSYSARLRRTGTGGWAEEITDITGTSQTFADLTASTAYELEVQAVNAAGVSAWVRATATTPAEAAADTPAPVASFQRYIGSTFANVTWTIAVPATQQVIDTEWRWNNGGGAWTTVDGVASTRAALLRQSVQGAGTINVQARAQYRLRVPPRTVEWSEWSNTVTFTFPAPASAQEPGMAGALIPITLDGLPFLLDGQPVTLES